MSRIEGHIRSLGMSGMLIGDEIGMIEESFGLDLGHASRRAEQLPVDYYPQFELSVRSEASEMAKHYELFYCLEKS